MEIFEKKTMRIRIKNLTNNQYVNAYNEKNTYIEMETLKLCFGVEHEQKVHTQNNVHMKTEQSRENIYVNISVEVEYITDICL